MKTVLISGANGFIGNNLIRRLLKENIQIYALIQPGDTPRELLKSNHSISLVYCDLESENFFDINIPNDIDIFYHLAWIGVAPEERKSFDIQSRNLNMLKNVFKLAVIKHIKKMILPGSTNEYLYSGGLINKDSIPTPRDDYGSVKVAIRYLAKQMAFDNRIDFVYVVLAGIYSEQRRDNNVITYTISKLLAGEKPSLTKLEQLWDYVHIDDVAEALYLAGSKGKNGAFYAVGHGDNWPLYNYIEKIHQIINPSLPLGIGEIPYSFSELPSSCIDLKDITNDTGFIPKVSFEEGVRRVINNWEII